MVTLDGSIGDGSGQTLRAALSLSAVTGRPFRMANVRRGREKPGLLRQHLAAVNAAAAVCGATLDGAVIGSKSLTFSPGRVRAGEYHFALAAGAGTSLVLQTVLPPLLLAEGPSKLTLDGGTHVPGSPPFEFLEKAYVPLINRVGPGVSVTMQRAGFYPAGGGRVTAEVRPAASFQPLHLAARGECRHRLCKALVAALPGEIAVRELELVKRAMDWPDDCFAIRQLPEDEGPGNVLLVEVGDDAVTEVFAAFGQRGVRAEAVAESAALQAKAYLAARVPVAGHLAEQLLVPLAVTGGGSFLTTTPTRSAEGAIELIRVFLGTEVTVEAQGAERCVVTVPARGPK